MIIDMRYFQFYDSHDSHDHTVTSNQNSKIHLQEFVSQFFFLVGFQAIIQNYNVVNIERKHNNEILQRSIIDQHNLLTHTLRINDNKRLYDRKHAGRICNL